MQTTLYWLGANGNMAHFAARFLVMLYLHRAARRVRVSGLTEKY